MELSVIRHNNQAMAHPQSAASPEEHEPLDPKHVKMSTRLFDFMQYLMSDEAPLVEDDLTPPLDRQAPHVHLEDAKRRYASISAALSHVYPDQFPPRVIAEGINFARTLYHQRVHPVDPRDQPRPTNLELIRIGEEKIRGMATMIQSDRHNLDGTGRQILDVVNNYFGAGQKSENRAKLAKNGETPIQTVRRVIRLNTSRQIESPPPADSEGLSENDTRLNDLVRQGLSKQISTTEELERFNKAMFLLFTACGDAGLYGNVYVCGAIANLHKLPHSVISIRGTYFEHMFMVLTPNDGDATKIGSQPCTSINDLSHDCIVVDPEMKISCPGHHYKDELLRKLDYFNSRNEVLLNHRDRIAFKPLSDQIVFSLFEGNLTPLDVSNYSLPVQVEPANGRQVTGIDSEIPQWGRKRKRG
jgi:hypothetical protein